MLAAVVAIGAGVLIWSGTIADDGGNEGQVIVLDQPGEYVDPAISNPPNSGDPLPDVELTDGDGASVRLGTDGRPMVVNLWYSNCPPCARELTYFAAVESDVGDDVRFVGVNPYDTASTMSRFAADRGVTYELLRDPDFALADELRIVAYPVTLFVGADGRIVERTGPLDAGELRARIAEHWPS